MKGLPDTLAAMHDSFKTRAQVALAGQPHEVFRLDRLPDHDRLPYSIQVLLENLLRHEDGSTVTQEMITTVLNWAPKAEPTQEIAFRPARVLLQDFTGVPAVVDLAAMRDAMYALGGNPAKINPLCPAELVIDHSVIVDHFGNPRAFALNAELEFARNRERYALLHWGQEAFADFKVVPPDTGIVHQVNLEHLARVVFTRTLNGRAQAYPDTLVGTDSHTTMINGLGVLGWGAGGIEAEAALLGQPIAMLLPQVVGVELTNQLPAGATATDLVLTITQMLRQHGVVGKFVEFFGAGLSSLSLADRATIANMAPEYGATCGLFPVDEETLRYLALTGRPQDHIERVRAYYTLQGMFRTPNSPPAEYSARLPLDLGAVEPSLAGPKRPQDRIGLRTAKPVIQGALQAMQGERSASYAAASTQDLAVARLADEGGGGTAVGGVETAVETGIEITLGDGGPARLADGAVVIAAITSCTNTSNPTVMLGAGLLAKNALARGLTVRPWVKTSLAPGSQVVTDYLKAAGLLEALEQLGFHLVGYGCTTCIGNSGPLIPAVEQAITEHQLIASAVLSGNRNFEGRVHPQVRLNFLASPPLVVAYALAGTVLLDPYHDPLGHDKQRRPVFLKDLWPSAQDIETAINQAIRPAMYEDRYRQIFAGNERWTQLAVPRTERYPWDRDSTYIQAPPFFAGLSPMPEPVADIHHARALALLGDSITTDHISPAGAIRLDSPAGHYLRSHGVAPHEFNSYGARRGNHEVMVRGTFANIRLKNQLAPGTEGGFTTHYPSGEVMSIYDAAMRYQVAGVPLMVIAGKEYGSGSSRDWAAKGPRLLGVRAVIAESYERIHRSNLIGMGILPLEFKAGENAATLGLTGREVFAIEGLQEGAAREVTVTTTREDGTTGAFKARVRLDTPQEIGYFQHGGILPYVLRDLVKQSAHDASVSG